MEPDWAMEIERRFSALLTTHGDGALTAAVSGFFFVLGAAAAVGALAACRRAWRARRQRRWRTALGEDVTVESRFAVAAPGGLPPLPTRWLN
jgi:hypothetical protein